MLEEHGLTFLLHLVQLDLARQAADQAGVTVTPEDVKEERDLTFKRMLSDSQAELRQKLEEAVAAGDNAEAERIKAQLEIDPEAALDAYLAQQYTVTRQYVSKGEFNLVLKTNAYLRKIAEASPDIEKVLTEDTVRKAFAAQFGEKVVIRHLQANNLETITEARRRLGAGESFADVATALSTNPHTAPAAGAVPPFTMNATNIPQVLKDAAFGLAEDEVSDTVHTDNAYHILKLENRIAPKVVKFENVKDSLRASLYDQVLQAAVKQRRDTIARQALANMRIEHPVLKQQFERRRDERRVQDQQQLDQQMKRDRAVTTPAEKEPEGDPSLQLPPAEDEPAAQSAATPSERAPAPAPTKKAPPTGNKSSRPKPSLPQTSPPVERPGR